MDRDWPAPERSSGGAQLEATMYVLDTLDDLRREVDALRSELPRPRSSVPVGVIARVAAEAGVLVAVAVLAGAGHFRPLLTIALMAVALVAVVLSEILASRAAYVPPAFGFAQARPPVADLPPETPLESDAWDRGLFPEAEPARL
jgi:hypothetical protein